MSRTFSHVPYRVKAMKEPVDHSWCRHNHPASKTAEYEIVFYAHEPNEREEFLQELTEVTEKLNPLHFTTTVEQREAKGYLVKEFETEALRFPYFRREFNEVNKLFKDSGRSTWKVIAERHKANSLQDVAAHANIFEIVKVTLNYFDNDCHCRPMLPYYEYSCNCSMCRPESSENSIRRHKSKTELNQIRQEINGGVDPVDFEY